MIVATLGPLVMGRSLEGHHGQHVCEGVLGEQGVGRSVVLISRVSCPRCRGPATSPSRHSQFTPTVFCLGSFDFHWNPQPVSSCQGESSQFHPWPPGQTASSLQVSLSLKAQRKLTCINFCRFGGLSVLDAGGGFPQRLPPPQLSTCCGAAHASSRESVR